MYYRLDWKVLPADPALSNTGHCPDLGVPWTMGARFKKTLPEPIVCSLNPSRGPKLRDLYLTDVPLFSDRLLSALSSAGVDNFDAYRAELLSPTGERSTNYSVVNILGLVHCADMQKSQYLPNLPAPLIEFTRLVVDSNKTGGQDFFRLGENSLYIVLSERIKQVLDRQRFDGMSLTPIETV